MKMNRNLKCSWYLKQCSVAIDVRELQMSQVANKKMQLEDDFLFCFFSFHKYQYKQVSSLHVNS